MTASYWGISETVIHFVIYEYLKKQLAIAQNKRKTDEKIGIVCTGGRTCGVEVEAKGSSNVTFNELQKVLLFLAHTSSGFWLKAIKTITILHLVHDIYSSKPASPGSGHRYQDHQHEGQGELHLVCLVEIGSCLL